MQLLDSVTVPSTLPHLRASKTRLRASLSIFAASRHRNYAVHHGARATIKIAIGRRRSPGVGGAASAVATAFRLYMWSTCFYVDHMSVMIQIRNVPDALHRRLKSRAALAGMSLSDYLLAELRRIADWPTVEELRQRLAQGSPTNPRTSPEAAVRAERDAE